MNLLVKIVFVFIFIINNIKTTKVKRESTNEYLLYKDIIPQHYNIHFIFDVDVFHTKKYTGIIEIYFDILRDTNKIRLNSKKLQILNAEIWFNNTGHPIDYTSYQLNDKTEMIEFNSQWHLLKNSNYLLHIDFRGKLNTKEMHGFYFGKYEDDWKSYNFVVTQLKPIYAREVFPCFDEPAFKATFNITTSVPKGYDVRTNTRSYDESYSSIERRIKKIKFERTPKMSTYLLAILISNFNCKSFPEPKSTFFYICSRDQKKYHTRLTRDYTPIILNQLETVLDMQYNKSGIKSLVEVAIPEPEIHNMENWGLITMRESDLLIDPYYLSNSEIQKIIMLIAHEIAHHWFGNLVTLREWTYLFLNEGFADFFQFYILNQINSTWEVEKQFPTQVLQTTLAIDIPCKGCELRSYALAPNEILGKFTLLANRKGVCLLRMIAHFMTIEGFMKGVLLYINKYKFDNTIGQHLWNALDSFAILPKHATFKDIIFNWVFESGYPLLHVSIHTDSNTSNIIITQEPFFKTNNSIEWYVPISYTLSSDQDQFVYTTARAWLMPYQILNITNVDIMYPNWIILNNQQTGYYRVNYHGTLWYRISSALREKNFGGIDALSRSQLVDDLIHMALNGRMSYKRAFSLMSFLKNDTDYYSWYPAIKYLSNLLPKLRGNKIEEPLKKYILKMIENVYTSIDFEQNKTNHVYGLKQELIIDFACKLNHPNCVGVSKEYFRNHKFKLRELNPNIKEAIICTSLRHTDNIEVDFNYLREELIWSTRNNQHERDILIRSLGCTRDSARQNELFSQIVRTKPQLNKRESMILFESITSNDFDSLNTASQYIRKSYLEIQFFFGSDILVDFIKIVVKKFTTRKQFTTFKKFINKNDIPQGIKNITISALQHAQDNLNATNKMLDEITTYFSSALLPNIHVFMLLTLILNQIF